MSTTRNTNSLTWFVVVVAGLVVLAVVWGLELHSRLDAGQRVLDGARPEFTEERVAGDRVGITMIDSVTDMVDPIIDAEGGAAGEVGPLVDLVGGRPDWLLRTCWRRSRRPAVSRRWSCWARILPAGSRRHSSMPCCRVRILPWSWYRISVARCSVNSMAE